MTFQARPLPPITVAVVGRPFPNADGTDRGAEIALCRPGEPIDLRLEPDNKFDRRAVAVFSGRGVQLGYLSAERCGWIGGIMRSGRDHAAIFQAETDFGAWARIAFDGAQPDLPPVRTPQPVEPEDGWFPDEIWPDDGYASVCRG